MRQIDLAVSPFDWYKGNDRMRLDVIVTAASYLPTLRRRLDELDGTSFDVALYNAGMDPFEGCAVGGMHGMTAELLGTREEMVFAWCRARALPTAFVLAGGYVGSRLDQDGLVALHRLTIQAAG